MNICKCGLEGKVKTNLGEWFCLKCAGKIQKKIKILKKLTPKPVKKVKKPRKKSLKWHYDRAWKEFSLFIRARDGYCVTCPTINKVPAKELQAAHFIKKSQCHNYFNFNEVNINACCQKCNVFLDGNYIAYTHFMQAKYGLDIWEKLKAENLKFKNIKPDRDGYDKIYFKYKNTPKD